MVGYEKHQTTLCPLPSPTPFPWKRHSRLLILQSLVLTVYQDRVWTEEK